MNMTPQQRKEWERARREAQVAMDERFAEEKAEEAERDRETGRFEQMAEGDES